MNKKLEYIMLDTEKPSFLSVLGGLEDLPSLPIVVTQLTELLKNENTSIDDVVKLLMNDPSITANILKLVNSAFYSGSYNQEVTSLKIAVSRLGLTTTRNLALTSSMFTLFSKSESPIFDREQFWRHSIGVGVTAKVVYEYCQDSIDTHIPQDILHTAGVMHDLGKIVLPIPSSTQARITSKLANSKTS